MTSGASADLVDFSQVDALLQVAGRDGVDDIMRAFWRSTDDLARRLRVQLGDRNYAEAARTAHALKGSAANVGASLLAAAARSVEICCKALDEPGAKAALDNLDQVCSRTRLALTAHIEAAA
jgi:HPt (histidine-containing phosphotransfer) domain-containing protein